MLSGKSLTLSSHSGHVSSMEPNQHKENQGSGPSLRSLEHDRKWMNVEIEENPKRKPRGDSG
ncbi:rCG37189 [Rattus norvegicus]|uniref:RCG37189 n=1 Tax=Rattus norvegicus TaxID=10116 RepID=A6HUG4_RAT|nr:rCG37189 [Rattus norvegicus]